MVAGITGDRLNPRKIRLVDRGHHLDHLARHLFLLDRIADKVRLIAAGSRMAIRAIQSEVSGDDAHSAKEVIDAQILESAGRDILEKLPGFHALWRCRHLSLWCRSSHKNPDRKSCRSSAHKQDLLPRLHIYSLRMSAKKNQNK